MFSRHRIPRRLAALVAAALLAVSGCGNTDSWVDAAPAAGWPAQYADAANSSYTATAGAESLKLTWSRSVKGSLFASVALGGTDTHYLAANAQTAAGCSLMVWEYDNNGRQRWCTRLVLGGGFASPLFDKFDNLYVGQPGTMLSFPHDAVVALAASGDRDAADPPLRRPQSAAGGHASRSGPGGRRAPRRDDRVGGRPGARCQPHRQPARAHRLPGRRTGLPRRGRARATPKSTGLIVTGIWQPGAPAATLTALRYRADGGPVLSPEWSTDAVTSGVIGSPVFSADGSTVYVNSRDGKLWALDSKDGKAEMVCATGLFTADTAVCKPTGGLLVSGGGPDAKLVAVRDNGERGDVIWRRDDVTPLCTASLAGDDIGYTVVRSGDNGAGAAGLPYRRRAHRQHLPPAAGHRLAGRGLRRHRPPRGHRDQRRPGVRLRPGLIRRFRRANVR